MINLKALALGSVLALSSVFGTVGAAEARPSQCWNFNGNGGGAYPHSCDVTRQVDSKGTWWSIDYDQKMIRLYDDGSAQIWFNGGNNNGGKNWYLWGYDSDGDIRIYSGKNGNTVFAFRR